MNGLIYPSNFFYVETDIYNRLIYFLLYRKVLPIKAKTRLEDAHEFVWKMYCVPNSALQSVQAHCESVMWRSMLARFVRIGNHEKRKGDGVYG